MFVIRESNNNNSRNKKKKKTRCGKGILNTVINKVVDHLPFELHIPNHNFCGPGTRLDKRLKRGDVGINPLDEACKEHDIAYLDKDTHKRREADKILATKAWSRVKSKDAKLKERLAALAVTGVMKGKAKLGAGVRKKRVVAGGKNNKKKKNLLKSVIQSARKAISRLKPGSSIINASALALKAAHRVVKQKGGKKKHTSEARVIPVPVRVGGFLPLIPIFAALSAIGGIAGGAAGVANAVQKASALKKQLSETQRHNHVMEAVALRGGRGLYLAPYKKGLGLYMRPWSK